MISGRRSTDPTKAEQEAFDMVDRAIEDSVQRAKDAEKIYQSFLKLVRREPGTFTFDTTYDLQDNRAIDSADHLIKRIATTAGVSMRSPQKTADQKTKSLYRFLREEAFTAPRHVSNGVEVRSSDTHVIALSGMVVVGARVVLQINNTNPPQGFSLDLGIHGIATDTLGHADPEIWGEVFGLPAEAQSTAGLLISPESPID